jgi:hypothetical protein
VDVSENGFPEDNWPGRRLRVGPEVVLRVLRPLIRRVMIDMAQGQAGEWNDLLKILAEHHEMTLGVVAASDVCSWE